MEGLPYRRPTQQALTDFVAILRSAGISVKVRKRKGADIDAACGQLRRAALAAASARSEAKAPELVAAWRGLMSTGTVTGTASAATTE